MKNGLFWGIFACVQGVGILCVAIGHKIGFLTVVLGTVFLMPGLWVSSIMLANNLLGMPSGEVINFAAAVLLNFLVWMSARRIFRSLGRSEQVVPDEINDS